VLLVCAACRENELASGHIVVRDAHGAVERELRAMPYGYLAKPDGVRIRVSGALVDAGEVRFEKGRLYGRAAPRVTSEIASLERAGARIVLYDPLRAPLGQIVEREGRSWAYDPGGTPLGMAQTDGDRVVLTDRDGAARGYVTGLPRQAAAVLMLGGRLSALDRDVLALALARGG
jgi:hypothetical protein